MSIYYLKRPNEPWQACDYESYLLMCQSMWKLGNGYGVARVAR